MSPTLEALLRTPPPPANAFAECRRSKKAKADPRRFSIFSSFIATALKVPLLQALSSSKFKLSFFKVLSWKVKKGPLFKFFVSYMNYIACE